MRQELQDRIVNDFPDLFINYKDQRDTFWIPDGWYDLIYNLSSEVNDVRKSLPNINAGNLIVVQIKIKFNGLRYYMNESNEIIDELIAGAENKSYNICILCGFDSKDRYLDNLDNVDRSHNSYCDTCSIIKNIIE